MSAYLKMTHDDGSMIKGESKDAGHLNWIKVDSYKVDKLPRRPTLELTVLELTVIDASLQLARAARDGDQFPTVILDVVRMWFLFRDAMITSYQFLAGPDRAASLLKINFKSAEYHQGPYTHHSAAPLAGQAFQALTHRALMQLISSIK